MTTAHDLRVRDAIWKKGMRALKALASAKPPKKKRSKLDLSREEFIESFANWQYYVTPTFKYDRIGEERASRLLKGLPKRLAIRLRTHVTYVVGVERSAGSLMHGHLLFVRRDSSPLFTPSDIEQAWYELPLAGDLKIQRYIVGGGAAGYVVKDGDYDLAVACHRPSRCRQGCVENL